MTASIRSTTGAPHARMLGIGTYRPNRVVTNDEICRQIDSDDAWIRSRSGIVTRHWARLPEESLLEMSVAAAGKALVEAGITPEQVGCIIVGTSTHPHQTPPLAPQIADRLNGSQAVAFDVSAGCAGFCLGLALASDMVKGGSAEYVLVIGVERLSVFVDPTDRDSAFIFGDGAGAAVVGPSDTPAIGPVVWGSDGAHAEAIGQTYSWDDMYPDYIAGLEGEQPLQAPMGPGADRPLPVLKLEGQRLFRFASFALAPLAKQALDKAGVAIDDLDAFIPHQSNLRIVEALARTMKLPPHVPIARDGAQSGNTSAASIPLAIETMRSSGEVQSGGTALLVGLGAGLVWAVMVVTLP